jgi:K+/H+ antiporter YhaU regulatory subunit KhtT
MHIHIHNRNEDLAILASKVNSIARSVDNLADAINELADSMLKAKNPSEGLVQAVADVKRGANAIDAQIPDASVRQMTGLGK